MNKAHLIILALVGTVVTSCSELSDVNITAEQLQSAETIYTAAGGKVKYRVIPVSDYK